MSMTWDEYLTKHLTKAIYTPNQHSNVWNASWGSADPFLFEPPSQNVLEAHYGNFKFTVHTSPDGLTINMKTPHSSSHGVQVSHHALLQMDQEVLSSHISKQFGSMLAQQWESTIAYLLTQANGSTYDPHPMDPIIGPYHGHHPIVQALKQSIPDIDRMSCKHPVNGNKGYLVDVIISLNDTLKWSREKIADWLETLDLDLRFKTPEEVKEG